MTTYWTKQPIDGVRWIEVSTLRANDYNPNHVYKPELALLETSIRANGWIFPIVVNADMTIIDGFHRATLARLKPDLAPDGKVPCVVLDLDEPARMAMTVRMNRAKGQHIALRMGDLVKKLHRDHGRSVDALQASLGMERNEVELLLTDNVFRKLGVVDTAYSRAWVTR